MDKKELLGQIQSLAKQQIITKDEVVSAFDAGIQTEAPKDEARQAGISHILYYIGGAVVFIGIVILIGQNWKVFNNMTKIISTLGSGVAAYFTALAFSRQERFEVLSRAFYFIAALVMPLGLHITFDIAGLDTASYGIQSLVSGILLTTFVLSYLINRKTVFALFNIIFGTWLFFAFTSFIVGNNPSFDWHFSAYRVLCIGLTYGLLGYHCSRNLHKALTGVLYSFGAIFFLGAALALGDWNPRQSLFWELAFPGFVFGIIFLSVYLRSKALLTFSSLYLVAYIFKITAEYFSKSLGWPLVLVLTGLGLICIGYLHFSLKRRYLS